MTDQFSGDPEILPAEFQEVPAPPVLITRTGKQIKYIRPEEVHRILAVLEGRDHLLVEILWNTGARISEVLALTRTSVNFEEPAITFRTLKKKRRRPKEAKKIMNEIRGLELALKDDPGSKMLTRKLENARKRLQSFQKNDPPIIYRTVPIRAELAAKIANYCMKEGIKANDRLFPISRVRAYLIIQKAGEKAGIEKGRRHPHVFRHGFAVNAVLSGVPPLVLRRWMGHASLDSTLIYTEVLAQDTKTYLDRMRF